NAPLGYRGHRGSPPARLHVQSLQLECEARTYFTRMARSVMIRASFPSQSMVQMIRVLCVPGAPRPGALAGARLSRSRASPIVGIVGGHAGYSAIEPGSLRQQPFRPHRCADQFKEHMSYTLGQAANTQYSIPNICPAAKP